MCVSSLCLDCCYWELLIANNLRQLVLLTLKPLNVMCVEITCIACVYCSSPCSVLHDPFALFQYGVMFVVSKMDGHHY